MWRSEDSSIVSVSPDGKLVARAAGTARIIAGAGALADTTVVMIDVAEPVASISLNVPDGLGLSAFSSIGLQAIAKGESGAVLENRLFTWTTSDASIASVSEAGLVTANSAGTARITASTEGQSASIAIVVFPPRVARIQVSFSADTIGVGQTAQATAVALDSKDNVITGQRVSWSFDDPKVAVVSASGAISGTGLGSTTILAHVNGTTGSRTITVASATEAAQSGKIATVTVTVSPSALTVGQTATATAVARDAGGNVLQAKQQTWTSLSPGVVLAPSFNGATVALSEGSAMIRATLDGVVGQTMVSVRGAEAILPAVEGLLGTTDFDNGAMGPFWIGQASPDVDVIDDPTGSGHGKVARSLLGVAPGSEPLCRVRTDEAGDWPWALGLLQGRLLPPDRREHQRVHATQAYVLATPRLSAGFLVDRDLVRY